MQEDNQGTFCYNPGKESTTMRIQGGGEEIQGPSKKTDNIEEVSWELNYVTWKVIQGPPTKIYERNPDTTNDANEEAGKDPGTTN